MSKYVDSVLKNLKAKNANAQTSIYGTLCNCLVP